MKEIKGIIFDFDFTLADSSRGVIECVNYAFKRLNLRIPGEKEIRKTIGLSLENTFIKLSENQQLDNIEKFKHYFIEKADLVMANLTDLYDDTYSVIKILRSNGIKLGIVSTKFRYRIESILRREGILKSFEVIIGGEDVPILKPNPRGLLMAVEQLKLSTLDTLYIGDTIVDAETAFNAGISFIAVLSGPTHKLEFKEFPFKQILKNLSELPNLLSIK